MEVKLFSEKRFDFKWETAFEQVSVVINLPDLSSCKFSCGGDWGPMYEFTLKPRTIISISYTNSSSGLIETYDLDCEKLRVESPVHANLREVTPYFYIVIDKEKQLKYEIYVDKDFEMKKVDIFRTEDDTKISSSISNADAAI